MIDINSVQQPTTANRHLAELYDYGQQDLLALAKRTTADTPFLLIDLAQIQTNCYQLQRLFPKIDIYYAIKANPSRPILSAVYETGVGFEVASSNELQQTLAVTKDIKAIISSHPVKTPHFTQELAKAGATYFVFDTKCELDKIAKYARHNARVVLRLAVDSTGSELALSEKFGAAQEDAIDLMLYAKHIGLDPYGLTFHVGSQCRNASAWEHALQLCHVIISDWQRWGELHVINMGGGFPAKDRKKSCSIEDIAKVVNDATKKYLDETVHLMIEPGRFILDGSGVLVTSVIGHGQRKSKNWLHIDAGIYGGLFETMDAIEYEMAFDVDSTRSLQKYSITGPSCDSLDTPFPNCNAPHLEIGERVYILNANAYTTVLSNHFNGFAPAQPIFIGGTPNGL